MSSETKVWTVLAMLEWATEYFKERNIPEPRLSIEWILAEVLSVRRLDLYMQFDRPLSQEELDRLRPLVKRRAMNEPVQYIIGKTEFHSAEILVNRSVLIPRVETEQLVDTLLKDSAFPAGVPLKLIDIGTGSGCIPIAVKLNRPLWSCSGVDISADALGVARKNALHNQTDIQFVQADFEKWEDEPFFHQKWDIVISNPPYITFEEESEMHSQVKEYEPGDALFHENPLEFYEKLIDFASASSAALFLECNDKTAARVEKLTVRKFPKVSLHNDLDGNPRFVLAKPD